MSITVMVGPSGSGKSTEASKIIATAKNFTIRICRDNLREMLFGLLNSDDIADYYKSSHLKMREQEVTRCEDVLIKDAVKDNINIVVDATHLQKRFLDRFKYFGTNVYYKVMYTDRETCIKRDIARRKSVGGDIIVKQFASFSKLLQSYDFASYYEIIIPIEQDLLKTPCFVFDIDGTLAHKHNRSAYDWDKVDTDTVDINIRKILHLHRNNGYEIIICTGRDGKSEQKTRNWLQLYNIKYDKFYIRPAGNSQKDYNIKEGFWRDICKDHYIVAVYDDRDQVIDRGRQLGLKMLQCEYGNF